MSRPVIGITTYLERASSGVWNTMASFLPDAYIRSVTDAGATAMLLPPQPVHEGAARDTLRRLDGLIIAGGPDIDPARYGQNPAATAERPRPERDAWEMALVGAALELQLPTLGICRGHQVINVALGGTLHQHLPDVTGSPRYSGNGDSFAENRVVLAGGRVGAAFSHADSILVRSYHHQALATVAPALVVTARGAADGVVQAVEHTEHPFLVGVQWHPEQTDDDGELFRALARAASGAPPTVARALPPTTDTVNTLSRRRVAS